MKLSSVLAAALLGPCQVNAAAVFAHFMLMNADNYTTTDWETDIQAAQDAHIDAFALNIASDPRNSQIMLTAFEVASDKGFKLFLSFDYAGNGPWQALDVGELLTMFTALDAYYQHNGKYLVSTFEGPAQAEDWITLKEEYNVFFMPDWSSVGAKPALQLGGGVADGLFSWAAWPWGPQDMDTYTDASYFQYLNESGAKPYMMAVSPWFFTNLPGYSKNWLWRGDDLWYDRWVEVIYNQPEFVEIISWNDYGESHYIGPLYDYAMEAFEIGEAPSNFAADMPHDGWRQLLPFVIDMYKSGTAQVTEESLVTWYRLSPGTACDGGTTGNTASQLQLEFAPSQIVQDRIFFSALLATPATVTVSVGGVTQTGSWTWTPPDGGVGIYHGSVPFAGAGNVVVTLVRDGNQLAQVNGRAISSGCTDGLFNAWVGSDTSSVAVSASPSLLVSEEACINGTGANNFAGLCEFACEYGYCPVTACTCRQMGKPIEQPESTAVVGYPIAGEDASYAGLCAFNCNLGYCPDSACGTEQVPLIVPTVSDFAPPACVAGTGSGALEGLCSFGCNYGFCPMHACTCTAQGALVQAPDTVGVGGAPVEGLEDFGLCNFACSHGYCPEGACESSGQPSSGEVLVPPEIWQSSEPDVQCIPPCTIILPPYPLDSTTTIPFGSMVTSFWTSSGTSIGTKTTILGVPSLVTDGIPFWPVVIGASATPTLFYPLQSLMPPSTVIVLGGDEATFSPVPSGSATPSPIFPGTPYSVTVQAQATNSVAFGSEANVPSVTWSSATPTETCTSGCGTNSCELFGGCDSNDPIDDCGTYGCGGGCSIQGCDQSCGFSCSTDQYHLESDSSSGSGDSSSNSGSTTGQKPKLPFDYDGPDGLPDGDWNPVPIDIAAASAIRSSMSSEMATATPVFQSAESGSSDQATSAQATVTAVKQAMATHVSQVQTMIGIENPDADNSSPLQWFSDILSTLEDDLDTIAEYVPSFVDEVQDAIEEAQNNAVILSEGVAIEAGDDICETWPETPPSPLRKRAPASCQPGYTGPLEPATNEDVIPDFTGCNTRLGFHSISRSDIVNAMEQGVRYRLSPLKGAPRPGAPNWLTATKSAYPHVYSNGDNLPFAGDCMNAGTEFGDLLEFPIMPDGSLLVAGKNSRIDVGTDRVVFKANADGPSIIFCGVMTHFTAEKVTQMIGDKLKKVLPFDICGATCAADVLSECNWLWS